jgi:hypothetical protein
MNQESSYNQTELVDAHQIYHFTEHTEILENMGETTFKPE